MAEVGYLGRSVRQAEWSTEWCRDDLLALVDTFLTDEAGVDVATYGRSVPVGGIEIHVPIVPPDLINGAGRRRAFLTNLSVPWPTPSQVPSYQLPSRWWRAASSRSAVARDALRPWSAL